MIRIFGIFITVLLSTTAFAESELTQEQELLKQVDLNLDLSIRCSFKKIQSAIGTPSSQNLGHEIRVWWETRSFRKKFLSPLITKVQALNEEADAAAKISSEMNAFRADTLHEIGTEYCTDKTNVFLKSVENYIEVLTAR